MAIAYLHQEPIRKFYYGTRLSTAQICCIIAYVIIVILPFFLAHATNRFYQHPYDIYDQPNVTFRNEMIVNNFAVGSSGNMQISGYSTIPDLNQQFINKVVSPSIKLTAVDNNYDGKIDYFDFQISFLQISQTLKKTEVFLFFDYQFNDKVRMQLTDFVIVEFSSASGMTGGQAFCNMNLRQIGAFTTGPLVKDTYNVSYLSNYTLSTDFTELINSKTLRNESLRLDYTPFVYSSTSSPLSSIMTFGIRVSIPSSQGITVFPNLLENIKFAWIQYISLLIPIVFVVRFILRFSYHFRICKTRVSSDLAKEL